MLRKGRAAEEAHTVPLWTEQHPSFLSYAPRFLNHSRVQNVAHLLLKPPPPIGVAAASCNHLTAQTELHGTCQADMSPPSQHFSVRGFWKCTGAHTSYQAISTLHAAQSPSRRAPCLDAAQTVLTGARPCLCPQPGSRVAAVHIWEWQQAQSSKCADPAAQDLSSWHHSPNACAPWWAAAPPTQARSFSISICTLSSASRNSSLVVAANRAHQSSEPSTHTTNSSQSALCNTTCQ